MKLRNIFELLKLGLRERWRRLRIERMSTHLYIIKKCCEVCGMPNDGLLSFLPDLKIPLQREKSKGFVSCFVVKYLLLERYSPWFEHICYDWSFACCVVVESVNERINEWSSNNIWWENKFGWWLKVKKLLFKRYHTRFEAYATGTIRLQTLRSCLSTMRTSEQTKGSKQRGWKKRKFKDGHKGACPRLMGSREFWDSRISWSKTNLYVTING